MRRLACFLLLAVQSLPLAPMKRLRLACALSSGICLGLATGAAAANAFNAGWSSNLVFTVVDRAEIIKTQNQETTTNRLEIKFLMNYRAETNGLFSLRWARATPLSINGLASGHRVFNAVAPGLGKMWTTMPSPLIDPSGAVVGVINDEDMAKALGNYIRQFDRERGTEVEESFQETMSSPRIDSVWQQVIGKIWNYWVPMWDWDTDVPELQELMAEAEPAEVHMEMLAPMIEGGDPIPTTAVFEHKGRREDGRLHLAQRTTYPFSEETARAATSFINSVAAEKAKIGEAEMAGAKVGKTITAETVIDPATLRPDWVKVSEETKAVEADGKAMVKIEAHEYAFNYQATEDDIRPSARATREYLDEIYKDLARKEERGRLIGYVAMTVVSGGMVGFAILVVWMGRRLMRKRSKEKTGTHEFK